MITINELQLIIAQNFTDGDASIAGLMLFCGVMGFIFMIFGRKSLSVPFIIMLPVTLIFTNLMIIPETLTILLIIVSVLGLAMVARDKVGA